MRIRALFPAAALVAAVAGCSDLTVPDYQNPPLDDLLTNPTEATVLAAATGVLQGTREDADTYVLWGGHLGREGYFLDPNESRYVRNLYAGTPRATNFTGSSYWTTPYRNIRTANILIRALDHANIALPAADEAAIRGFARTIQALDYMQILVTREEIPVMVDIALDSITNPAPIVSRAEAMAFISTLLDQGRTDLTAAGAEFPFAMPSGITQFGFDTPAQFIKFNRALKARIEVNRARVALDSATFVAANYQAALTALSQSFINPDIATADPMTDRTRLNYGVYQTLSSGAGDTPNSLNDPSGKTVADSTLVDLAQSNGGVLDARVRYKTEPGSLTIVSSLGSNLRFTIYNNRPFYGSGGLSSPIPMIRNEELILLRAEARWFTGDKAGAMADLNSIRQYSGGLAPIAQPANDYAFIHALLYERRYSLLFEGAHSWNDYRRFGMLSQLQAMATKRSGGAASAIATWLPLPSNETLPRT
ncbi:MAG TPA: RagB/SusD family nutrient uptake outer membrane protein [Longimicrobium sp.]|nr:RagB/SusD family nutrient uptake outer membrane protein [Longimicrobium sp.]